MAADRERVSAWVDSLYHLISGDVPPDIAMDGVKMKHEYRSPMKKDADGSILVQIRIDFKEDR